MGHSPSRLAAVPGTVAVSRIATAPQLMGTTNLYRLGFGIAAVVILFPLMILINTATRLAATRREERLAALRLVGATPRQVTVIASVDAVVAASAGVLIGVLGFLAIRPLLESISFSGVRFFGYTVTPTLWGYLGMIVLVPLLATASSLVSLRRVWISPLGVSRRTTPRPPGWWRVLPIVVGIPLFIAPVVDNPGNPDGTRALVGLFLIMAGLVLGGSWLTMQTSRVLARTARGPSALLAARRLADNPKGRVPSLIRTCPCRVRRKPPRLHRSRLHRRPVTRGGRPALDRVESPVGQRAGLGRARSEDGRSARLRSRLAGGGERRPRLR